MKVKEEVSYEEISIQLRELLGMISVSNPLLSSLLQNDNGKALKKAESYLIYNKIWEEVFKEN